MKPELKLQKRIIRHRRLRAKIHGTAERPRLSVFKSHQHVFLQLIDDMTGKTLASAGSHEATDKKNKAERTLAAAKLLAQRAAKIGIKQAVFDRGGYKFHGRVKAVADAVIESGLKI